MTRIVSGSAGGRVLKVPSAGTRPTSDRVREALFSTLEHKYGLRGAQVLDLYAGSGALAFEALSRGAASAVLVEVSRRAAQICKDNARQLGFGQQVKVVPRPVGAHLEVDQEQYDLVFIDPPYDLEEEALAANLVALLPRLCSDAIVVVERSSRSPQPTWPPTLELLSHRSYGESTLWLAQPLLP